MKKIILALAGALAISLPAFAADTFVGMVSNGVPQVAAGSGTVTGSTTCGSNALLFPSSQAGTAIISATGTFTAGSLSMQASSDDVNFSGNLTFYPRAGGAGVTSISAAGVFSLPMLGDSFLCVYGSGFTGAATVTVRFSPGLVSGSPLPTSQATTGSAGVTMLNAVSATGASATFTNSSGYTAHDIQVTTTGAPTYTIAFRGSLDNVNWTVLDQITSSTATPNQIASAGYYPYLSVNLTALSGGTLTVLYSGAVSEAPSVSIVGQVAGKAGVQSEGVDPVTGLAQNLSIDTTSNGLYTTVTATTANTATTQASFSVNTAANLKASAGNVYGIAASNAAASVCYLQFYNTAGTPTCGTSVVWSVPLPVTPGVFIQPVGPIPLGNFSAGIGICVSTTPTGAVTCGSTASGTVFFK